MQIITFVIHEDSRNHASHSAELAKNLGRMARGRGVPKSQVVREAVARYLAPADAVAPAPRITASSLASRWKEVPRLTPDEASEFRKDVEAARSELPALRPEWK